VETINIPKHNSLTDKDTAGNHAKIIPATDSTTALQITKANGTTAVVNVDTNNLIVALTAALQLPNGSDDLPHQILFSGTSSPSQHQPLKIKNTQNEQTILGIVPGGTDRSASIKLYAGNGMNYLAIDLDSAGTCFSIIDSTSINRLNQVAAETVFNESGAAIDFRVEGDTDANLLVVKGAGATKDRVGIGTTTPAEKLDVVGNINLSGVVKVDSVQVLKEQQAAVADATDAASAITQLNALLARLRAHGLIAT
jgi:hypothetical protein